MTIRQRVWGCDLTIKQKVFWCKFSSFAFPRILCSGCSRKSASVEILWSLGLGWLEWGAHFPLRMNQRFGTLIKYSKSLGSLSRAPLFALENDGFYGPLIKTCEMIDQWCDFTRSASQFPFKLSSIIHIYLKIPNCTVFAK